VAQCGRPAHDALRGDGQADLLLDAAVGYHPSPDVLVRKVRLPSSHPF